MNKDFFRLLALIALTLPTQSPAQWSGTEEEDELTGKTQSPYFQVISDDPEVDSMPLLSTDVNVNISGVIADVRVTQTYKNSGSRPIEAIYVFPGSTQAAVYAMKMTIGQRVLIAKIREKQQARAEYEQAKEAGKTASLLEQHRPNVFQMNVANIMPGDNIMVELSYTELLTPANKIYEFVYPTVAGPRYSNSKDEKESWISNPYLKKGSAPSSSFDIKVNISTAIPIQALSSPSHKINTAFSGKAEARAILDRAETNGGNRDYVLRYQLAGGKIQTGLLLYQGEGENFFLLIMQPPERPALSDIPPRDYIFIVDVSGSMNGFPLDVSKQLLKDLISGLRPTDTFNVLLFAGTSALWSKKSLPATGENIDQATAFIDAQQGSGGTELLPALKRALALPRQEGIARSIVIVTDGFVGIENESFELIETNLNHSNFFPFGIGSSVNRHLIEGMALAGQGEPFIVLNASEGKKKADLFRKYIESPVLTGISIAYQGFSTYDVQPESVPDILAERPVTVIGKWRGTPAGDIRISGFSGNSVYQQSIPVNSAKPRSTNSGLRYLWARQRIKLLSDYDEVLNGSSLKEEITRLGLTYNLLTDYTSFIAVDHVIRNPGAPPEPVKQPSPLPQGVSNLAVGGGQDFEMASLTLSTHSKKSQAPAGTRQIEGKTFHYLDGIWVDEAHGVDNTIIAIKNGSEACRLLLERIPELKKYLALGKSVIVNLGVYSVKLSDEGLSDISDELLQRLVTGSKLAEADEPLAKMD
ncbi:MAG TPA: VIT and VWA domain-containing protein [Gammaproteobacteria bacterium]|nr:VIT and VWA domain-containing protein [Gammaproteobacteria bacterium]